MDKKLTEQEIMNQLNIKDWRNLSKDKVVDLFTLFQGTDANTIKEILKQIPELKETSKEILTVSKDFYQSILKENEGSVNRLYDSIDSVIKFIQNMVDTDKDLTFEQKTVLIDKIIELLKFMEEIETKNKTFLNYLADNWGKITIIAGAVIGGVILVATGNGKKILDIAKNVGKKVV